MTRPLRFRDFACNGIVAAAKLRFGNDIFGKFGSRGDEDGECFRIMFGLGYQVGGDVCGAAAITGDDDFGGAGEHVDGAIESDEALGRGDIEIAGADDLVDARERLRFRRRARLRHALRQGDRTR